MRPPKRKKTVITTQLDSELKELFELHKVSDNVYYQDMLEYGIIQYLKSKNNVGILKLEIRDNEIKNEQLKAQIAEAEKLKRILDKKEDNKISKEDELEKERLEALKSLLKKPYSLWTAPNRSHAKAVGKFKTKEELKKWVTERQA